MPELSPAQRIWNWFIELIGAKDEEGNYRFADPVANAFERALRHEVTKSSHSSRVDMEIEGRVPGVSPQISAELVKATDHEDLIDAFHRIMLLVARAAAELQFGMAPAGILAGYEAEHTLETGRPPPREAFLMDWRGSVDSSVVEAGLKDLGWDPAFISAFRDILRPRPPLDDLIAWAWRKHRDPEVVREELGKRGMLTEDIDKYMRLAKRIPPITDLIAMAVREAFSPDAISKYGLGERYPEELTEWAEKQGLSEGWAKRYWYAHWRLPSTTMGIEMLHRGEIDRQGLEDLLTYADMAPGWIDKVINIGYMPYTRVDVRRMHKFGTLEDEDLLRAYMDVGFDEEKAGKMAEFTIAYNAGVDAEYTKGEVLNSYRQGMLPPEDAYTLLIDLGLSEDYAVFLLALEDYKRDKALLKLNTDVIEDRYVQWEIDAVAANSRLTALGLAGKHISLLMEEWGVARRAKIARPTRANVEEFYKDNVISITTARAELTRRRYPDDVVEWWLKSWDQQILEAAALEAERTQKEEERIAKSDFKTKRTIGLAHLNRQIAELNLQIAELKLDMFDMEGRPEYETIREQINKLWRDYWEAKTEAQREAIGDAIDALADSVGLLDAEITRAERDVLVAQRDVKKLQRDKADLPVVLEEER